MTFLTSFPLGKLWCRATGPGRRPMTGGQREFLSLPLSALGVAVPLPEQETLNPDGEPENTYRVIPMRRLSAAISISIARKPYKSAQARASGRASWDNIT